MLADLAEAPGSPGSMALLAGIDPEHLTLSERVDLVRAWERQQSWVVAQQLPSIVSLEQPDRDSRPTDVHLPDWSREELAAALHLSLSAAQDRLDLARDLAGRLTGTAEALRTGALSPYKAEVLAKGVRHLSDALAAAVEARVLPAAPGQTAGELRRAVARAVLALDPQGAADRAAEAVRHRGVEAFPLYDGMGGICAELAAADVQTVMAGLDCEAARILHRHRQAGTQADEVPGASARRADALLLWAQRALAEPNPPDVQGRRPRVQVTVSLRTLLGLDETPGELAGYGPIDADTARRLAADGTWRRLVTDPLSGAVLDYGRTTYQPPADLREFILARYPMCTFPGCDRPARRCQLDHIVEWKDGGFTCDGNLHPTCLRHHICKTKDGWTVTRDDDGRITWTSPAGKAYTTAPATVGEPDPPAAYGWPPTDRRLAQPATDPPKPVPQKPAQVEPEHPPF